ncbi:hypothetical protein SLEP1_g20393 [Rubroshorea leprosula]|uniref:Uncharacterized protein n=1 Tax=Rubroshorea leprosula TaxID=152421 RepID=A0AAV5J5U2_9ROSI|nr:hypothetical protein SLEP1_g20393 [Rubroshorea leprosula]
MGTLGQKLSFDWKDNIFLGLARSPNYSINGWKVASFCYFLNPRFRKPD